MTREVDPRPGLTADGGGIYTRFIRVVITSLHFARDCIELAFKTVSRSRVSCSKSKI